MSRKSPGTVIEIFRDNLGIDKIFRFTLLGLIHLISPQLMVNYSEMMYGGIFTMLASTCGGSIGMLSRDEFLDYCELIGSTEHANDAQQKMLVRSMNYIFRHGCREIELFMLLQLNPKCKRTEIITGFTPSNHFSVLEQKE